MQQHAARRLDAKTLEELRLRHRQHHELVQCARHVINAAERVKGDSALLCPSAYGRLYGGACCCRCVVPCSDTRRSSSMCVSCVAHCAHDV